MRLLAPQVSDGFMRVTEPQERKKTDQKNLTQQGEAVDQKGDQPANDRGFD
jgi:hypothetical protein